MITPSTKNDIDLLMVARERDINTLMSYFPNYLREVAEVSANKPLG